MFPAMDYLRSNFLLSYDELAIVRAEISDMEVSVTRLKKALLSPGDQWDTLLAALTQTAKDLSIHRALLAPIRLLPPEIMGKIFTHCLPSSSWLGDPARTGDAPLLLGRVCSAWRAISQGTPQLWASLTIDVDEYGPCHTIMVKEWLRRSGSLPLSLSIKSNTVPRDLMNVLLPHSYRLEMLYIPFSLAQQLLCEANTPLPILQTIIFTSSPRLPDQDAHSALFAAPRLNHAVISYIEDVTDSLLPWEQLTHLEGSVACPDGVVRVLPLCSDLRKLDLVLTGEKGADPQQQVPTIFLPKLYSCRLTAFFSSADTITTLLDALVVPDLTTLHINCGLISWRVIQNAILSLVTRSKCSLHTLVIKYPSNPPSSALIRLADSIPSLRSLTLKYPGQRPKTPDQVLDILSARPPVAVKDLAA